MSTAIAPDSTIAPSTTTTDTTDTTTANTITPNTTPPAEVAAKRRAQAAAGLLHEFDALTLGEGDLTAGGNTLALMALTIACTAPPGSCMRDPESGSSVPVGVGVLLSGALSCDIVDDLVLSLMRTRQSNLYGHIRQWMKKHKFEEQGTGGRRASPTYLQTTDEPKILLESLENRLYTPHLQPLDNFCELLHPPPKSGTREILEMPTLFASVDSVEGLEDILGFANRRCPLVHTPLSDDGDPTLLAGVCAAVMSGCWKRTPLSGSISGHVIVTDPMGVLGGMVREGGKGTGWLHHLLWLSDHAAGPSFELPDSAEAGSKTKWMAARFDNAFVKMASRRLNFREPSPVEVRFAFASEQVEWIAFLRDLEPRFPGITGTLRRLLASLCFGLLQLARAVDNAPNLAVVVKQIVAFAQLLALRMVNAREVMLKTGERKRLETLGTSILLKLADGPLQIRDLIRKSHRLDASTCLQVLENLACSGLVLRTGSHWQLTASKPFQPLTLDV